MKDSVTFPFSSEPNTISAADAAAFMERKGIKDNGSHVVPFVMTCAFHGEIAPVTDWIVFGCCGTPGHDCSTEYEKCWVLIRCAGCEMMGREVVVYARNAPPTLPNRARFLGREIVGRL